MRHPEAGIGYLEQDVDHLALRYEDRVLPDEIGFVDSVSGEDQEAAFAGVIRGRMRGLRRLVVTVHVVVLRAAGAAYQPRRFVQTNQFGRGRLYRPPPCPAEKPRIRLRQP